MQELAGTSCGIFLTTIMQHDTMCTRSMSFTSIMKSLERSTSDHKMHLFETAHMHTDFGSKGTVLASPISLQAIRWHHHWQCSVSMRSPPAS